MNGYNVFYDIVYGYGSHLGQQDKPARRLCVKCGGSAASIKYLPVADVLMGKCETCGFTNKFKPCDTPEPECKRTHIDYRYESELSDLKMKLRDAERKIPWWRR